MWFVYVKGLHGPEPQKWTEDFGDCDLNGVPHPHIPGTKVHLPGEYYTYSLDELSKMFPYEGEKVPATPVAPPSE